MNDNQLLLTARTTGFARDHLDTELDCTDRPDPIPPITDIREPFTFSSDDELPPGPSIEPPIERLAVDKETAEFLRSINRLDIDGRVASENELLKDPRSSKQFRLESPLLRASAENRSRPIRILKHLKKEELEAVAVDEEDDGGLRWSAAVKCEIAAFEKRTVCSEKLDVDEVVLRFLKEITRPPQLAEDASVEPISDKHIRRLEPLTPPLLPLSAIFPALPPLADLTGLQPIDAGTTEELINDLATPFTDADADWKPDSPSSSPSHFVRGRTSTPSPARKRPRPEDLKLEAPLTPPISVAKKVRFNSILVSDDTIPSPWLEGRESKQAKGETRELSPGEPEFMVDIARPAAVLVEREISQEQLQEADSTLRVPVPIVDQSLPKAPWDNVDGSLEQLRAVKSWAGLAARKWTGVRSIEIGLLWSPFPKDLKKIPTETIEETGLVESFLITEEDGRNAEEELLRKLGSFRFDTNDLEDEEPLEPADFSEEQASVIEEISKRQKRAKGPTGMAGKAESQKKRAPAAVATDRTNAGTRATAFDGTFSARSSLAAFMTIRGRQAKITDAQAEGSQSHPDTVGEEPNRLESVSIPAVKAASLSHAAVADDVLSLPPAASAEAAFPVMKLERRPPPGTFIVSTTLLAQRALFKHITELFQTARLVERDFSIPIPCGNAGVFSCLSSSQLTAHASSTSISESKADDEVDLILSPTTGVIIVSLQKLRQRSLPGEPAPFSSGSAIKERITNVCEKYETLIIIVWSRNIGVVEMGQSDAEVISGFAAFAAALQGVCTMMVRTVGGDEQDLAKWVVSLMVQEGSMAELLEEETLWELFLRKAGFNAFAAQVVLKGCRGEGRNGGLAGFLTTDKLMLEDRLANVVGKRVLARVLDRLEGVWGLPS